MQAPLQRRSGRKKDPQAEAAARQREVVTALWLLPHVGWIGGLDWLASQIDSVYMKSAQANRLLESVRLRTKELEKQRSLEPTQIQELEQLRRIGPVLARVVFLTSMGSIFGTPEAVRQHFQAIDVHSRKLLGNMRLHRRVADRLLAAREALRARVPGAVFPTTTNGQALRGRHQHQTSAGMLGHPLGVSVDYYAYENPHLYDRTLFLETIGGGPSRLVLKSSRTGTEMEWGERRRIIRQLGEETISGVPAGQRRPEGQHLLAELREAHTAMVKTSKAVQGSLPRENVAALRELAERYWQDGRRRYVSIREELGDIVEKRLPRARKAARQQLARQRRARQNEVPEGDIDEVPQVASVLERQAELQGELDELRAEMRPEFESLLAPHLEAIDQRIQGLDPRAIATTPEAEGVAESYLANLQQTIERAPTMRALRGHLSKNAKLWGDLPIDEFDGLEPLRRIMLDRILAVRLPRLRWRLTEDPEFVIGARHRKVIQGGRARSHERPPVLQLVEMGFIRDDEMAGAEEGGEGTGGRPQRATTGPTFNLAFFEVMVEHGFDPGASWGSVDSMHFDLVAGFDVFSGRKGKFGPSGHTD